MYTYIYMHIHWFILLYSVHLFTNTHIYVHTTGLDLSIAPHMHTHTHTDSHTYTQTPTYNRPTEDIAPVIPRQILQHASLLFNVIFVAEAFAKMAAFGIFYPTTQKYKAYFQV